MAFREVALDNKCVTQVLRGDANSAEVSYIAPENFSLKDRSISDDESETLEFSSLEPESHTHMKREVKISDTTKSPSSSDKISRYQVAKSSKSNLDGDEIHHRNASSKELEKMDQQQNSKRNASVNTPNSGSKQTHASAKLDAAIKLRDQLAKILGVDPKRSGQRSHRAASNTTSLPKNFGVDEFLFAGSRKPHANASEQSNQSAENKAEFEFANKLRSLVSGANLSQVRQPETQTVAPVHGTTTADKQLDRKQTVQKSSIVGKSAENVTVTENANERSAAAQEPEVKEAPLCATAPPQPPATAAMPELQSNEVVDLDASATRALAAQFEREQQAGQKQFLHRMPLVAAEDAVANTRQIQQAKASAPQANAVKPDSSAATQESRPPLSSTAEGVGEGEASLEGHLSSLVDRSKLTSPEALPFRSSALKSMMFDGLNSLLSQYGAAPLAQPTLETLSATHTASGDSDNDF